MKPQCFYNSGKLFSNGRQLGSIIVLFGDREFLAEL